MTPTHCRVRHEPENGTYGDCLRACVASMMDLPWDQVPHVADNGRDGDSAMAQLRNWMKYKHGHVPFIVAWPGDIALDDLLEMMRMLNPASTYILFGGTADGGDHCVVCQGGRIVHNPAWTGSWIVGPLSNGTWQALVVGRV